MVNVVNIYIQKFPRINKEKEAFHLTSLRKVCAKTLATLATKADNRIISVGWVWSKYAKKSATC